MHTTRAVKIWAIVVPCLLAWPAIANEQLIVQPDACQCVCPAVESGEETGTPAESMETKNDVPTADEENESFINDDSMIQNQAAPTPVFSELFPNPIGKDTDGEFIELTNPSVADFDLAGWSIKTDSGKTFIIASATLAAGGQMQFIYAESKLPLTNDGATLALVNPSGDIVDSVTYSGPAKEGNSFARNASSVWQWTSKPTPGSMNEFDSPPPATATATVTVATVSDDAVIMQAELPDADLPLISAENYHADTASNSCSAEAVRISEFLPDPEGDDASEWIELENLDPAEACLVGWSLDDGDGGSKPFALTATHIMPPNDFLLMRKSESKLALNNDGDSVRLLRPDGSVAEAIVYAEPPTGQSYSRTESGWTWTEPSPNAANVAALPDEPADAADDADTETEAPEEITTADIGEIDSGTLVSLSGIVTLPPGRAGKTIFFIQHDGTATKIRSYSKSLPTLSFGDAVRVTGRIRLASDRHYVSALSMGGVEKTGSTNLAATVRDIADISADDEGTYIKTTGILTKKGLNWLKIGDDSDSGEIRINLPETIASAANVGDSVTVAGTVRLKSGVPEIVILEMKGVAVSPAEAPEKAKADALPTGIAMPDLRPNEADHKIPAWPFLIFGAAAAGIVAVWKRTRPLPLADLPEPPGV